jgi:hypothetical protein
VINLTDVSGGRQTNHGGKICGEEIQDGRLGTAEVSSDVEIVVVVLRCMYLGIALNINSCHVLDW